MILVLLFLDGNLLENMMVTLSTIVMLWYFCNDPQLGIPRIERILGTSGPDKSVSEHLGTYRKNLFARKQRLVKRNNHVTLISLWSRENVTSADKGREFLLVW